MALKTTTLTIVENGPWITMSGGSFDVSFRFGTMVGTIQLQRSFDNGATVGVLRQVTNSDLPTALEQKIDLAMPCQVRAVTTVVTSGGPATVVTNQ